MSIKPNILTYTLSKAPGFRAQFTAEVYVALIFALTLPEARREAYMADVMGRLSGALALAKFEGAEKVTVLVDGEVWWCKGGQALTCGADGRVRPVIRLGR